MEGDECFEEVLDDDAQDRLSDFDQEILDREINSMKDLFAENKQP